MKWTGHNDYSSMKPCIDIMEKCYIIILLPSFARNLRNELKFDKKIYFWDMGIRNAIIGNYAPIELRDHAPEFHLREENQYYLLAHSLQIESFYSLRLILKPVASETIHGCSLLYVERIRRSDGMVQLISGST